MSDGVTLNPGSGGAVVDTETNAARGNAQMQRVKVVVGDIDVDGGDVALDNPMPALLAGAEFFLSVGNSSTTQLAAGASFVGAVESVVNQPNISVNIDCDQPYQAVLSQYIDALAATVPVIVQTYTRTAGQPFSASVVANSNYFRLTVTNQGSATTTTLNINSGYGTVPATTQYNNAPTAINEVNGTPLTGFSIPINVVGNPTGPWAGQDLLEQVIDDRSGIGFNTKILNQPKQDPSGALVLSDALPVNVPIEPVGATIIIDTTGYQSVNITTALLAANVTASNDLKTFSAVSGSPVTLGTLVTAVTASGNFWFPCPCRYLVLTPTTLGTATVYLRTVPWNGAYTTTVPTGVAQENLSQYGGTAVVTGGVAGVPSAGGNVAPGSARTANPVPVGGADASNLTRVLLTDNGGRPVVIGRGFTDLNNVPTVNVQNTEQADGLLHVELLALILQELRQANFVYSRLLYQFGEDLSPLDLRADPAIFTN